jgi:hypothetical protein
MDKGEIKMKKKYVAPELDIMKLSLIDVLVGSEQDIPVNSGSATGDGEEDNEDFLGGL